MSGCKGHSETGGWKGAWGMPRALSSWGVLGAGFGETLVPPSCRCPKPSTCLTSLGFMSR